MDIKEYISSGILETYVLGEATEQERAEVEQMAAKHPEVSQEIAKIEQQMEAYAFSISKPMPVDLKAKVLTKIKETKQDKSSLKVVKNSSSKKASKKSGGLVYKLSLAASVLILLGVGFLFYMEMEKVKELNNELAETKKTYKKEAEANATKFKEVEAELAILTDKQRLIMGESTIKTLLVPTDFRPEAKAEIYWEPKENKALLVRKDLPGLKEDQDYQLWAIVDGKPLDLGTFDMSSDQSEIVRVEMTKVDAFGITVEPKGGSPEPSLEQLVVIGNV